MICDNCGKEFDDAQKACPHCKSNVVKPNTRKDKYLLIAFGLFIVTLLVFAKPLIYTYFMRKAMATQDVEQRTLYAQKALKFSNVESGRNFYRDSMLKYIISISKDYPEKALQLCQSQTSGNNSDNSFNEGFADSYVGIGHKLVNIDENNALYNFIEGESYDEKTKDDTAYAGLLQKVIGSKLEKGYAITEHVVGDIDNDSSIELGVTVSNGASSRFLVFKYRGNDFVESGNITIENGVPGIVKFITLSKEKNSFVIIESYDNNQHSIHIVSNFGKDKIDQIYSNNNSFGFDIKDIDNNKIFEVGILNGSVDSKDLGISWLKYENSLFKYYKTTHPNNVQLDKAVDIPFLR